MTDAESDQFCQELATFFDAVDTSLKDGACRVTGLNATQRPLATTDATIQSRCQTAYDGCVAMPSSMQTRECGTKPSAACLATVSEFGACMNDQAAALDHRYGHLPACSALTVSNLQAAIDQARDASPTSASCTLAQQKCPELSGT